MKLRALGCSGGVGAGLRTTSLMVDEDILIDAGSGLGELYLEEMSRIRHIFLTHSHLDHVGFIPLLIDSVFERLHDPITVYAQAETIKALKDHIFNWVIWPDFSKLPSEDASVLRFEEMPPGTSVEIKGRIIESIGVNHTVPAVGYRVAQGAAAFAFTGDTTTNDTFWAALNSHGKLDLLIVECAFTNRQYKLAQVSHHYCPALLSQDLAKLKMQPEVYLTHLKPGEELVILSEARAAIQHVSLKTLVGGEIFQL